MIWDRNVDMGIYGDFRREMTNAFNMVNLSNPGTGANNSATVARITTASPMRQVQFGLRFRF